MNDFLKILAWNQAPNHFFLNSGQWRVDFAGKLIYWQAYGDRSHPYGWELGCFWQMKFEQFCQSNIEQAGFSFH